MEEIFATKIKINEVLNIKDFEIPLSETERRHLIITGKNGSGKTTILNELKQSLSDPVTSNIQSSEFNSHPKPIIHPKNNATKLDLLLNTNSLKIIEFLKGEFIIAFFGAKRNSELITPSGIKKIEVKPYYKIEDNAGQYLIQHMVNLKADRLFAKEENEVEEPKKIDDWFSLFEDNILNIFDVKGIVSELQFDRKNYNFNIVEPGKGGCKLNCIKVHKLVEL